MKQKCLILAFGGKETIKIEDLFADYRFDDDLVASYKKKYKGHTLETKLNRSWPKAIQ